MSLRDHGCYYQDILKLSSLANILGVSIEYEKDNVLDGCVARFIPEKNVIALRKDIFSDPEVGAYVIAHELGHVIDLISLDGEIDDCIYFVKLNVEFGGFITESMCNFLKRTELVACLYGEEILHAISSNVRKKTMKKLKNEVLSAVDKLILNYRKGILNCA